MCCNGLQCDAVCGSVLQCVAMCCSRSFFYSLFISTSQVNNFFVLQSVAVCCSLMHSLSLLCLLSVPRQQYSFPFPFSQVFEVFKILRFFCIFLMFSVFQVPLAFEIPHFFCICSMFFIFQVLLAFEFTHFFLFHFFPHSWAVIETEVCCVRCYFAYVACARCMCLRQYVEVCCVCAIYLIRTN